MRGLIRSLPLVSMLLSLASMLIAGWSLHNVTVSSGIVRELSARLMACQAHVPSADISQRISDRF